MDAFYSEEIMGFGYIISIPNQLYCLNIDL